MNLYRKLGKTASVLFLALAMAGCGGGGDDGAAEAERQALDAAQQAAAAAAMAAMAASTEATAAANGAEAHKAYDESSYALARGAANDAEEAYTTAKKANEAAQAATSSADAKMHQADAEAALKVAEAAQADAVMYAGMVADEATAFTSARTQSARAASAAEMAYMAAKEAVEAVADGASDAMDEYEKAQAAVTAAMNAYMNAKAASEAAQAAETSAKAKAQQDMAEAAKDAAEAAQADAVMYAGMVSMAHMAAQGVRDLNAAKMAASEAAIAARTAADAARTAADAIAAIDGADSDAVMRAETAARNASIAAALAEDASGRAQMAEALTDAETEKTHAESQRDSAVADQGTAEELLSQEQMAANERDEEEQQRMQDEQDIADARDAAMKAAEAARMAAANAQAEADKIAALRDAAEDLAVIARLTVQAQAAQEHADAANTAASAAEDARDAANAEMVSVADAMAAQSTAEDQQEIAEGLLADAEVLAGEAQALADAAIAEQEVRDLDTAQKAANDAAAEALTHYEEAMSKAESARTQANMANDAADRAASARTNWPKAREQATMAEAAAMAARDAQTAAETAKDNAQTAASSAADAETATDAKEFQTTAENERDTARDEATKAETQYMVAKTAAKEAAEYEKDHVVMLLMMANAEHITTAADPDANLDETELELIRKNKEAHIRNVNTAVKVANDDATDTTSDPSHGGGVVAATWPHSATVANNAATSETERTGKPVISITPTGGDEVALRHSSPGMLADDPADDLTDNFMINRAGLGDFVHEKYVHGLDTDTTDDLNDPNRQRVILFTDLTQATAPKDGTSDNLDNQSVPSHTRVDITANPTGSGVQGPGNTTPRMFAGTYDHDGNPDTPAFVGNFICVVPSCSYNLSGTNNAGEYQAGTEVTAISGYNFTGTRTVAPMAPMEDTTWLAFGIWLTETVVTGGDGVNTYDFGAFAGGGDAVAVTDNIGQVTGDATYRGKAAGVRSRATAVDFFHGDVTLKAEFGNGTANGTITGSIHDIMAGGWPVGEDIHLSVVDPGTAEPTPNIDTDGGFAGRARMLNTGVQDSSGEDIYRYTGTWTGNFYNHMEDDDATTTTVMENMRGPGSVAGTFGVGRADVASTMDVDETESYVGAFGAHCSGSNCNPHD